MKLTDVRKSGEELQSFFHSEFKVDLSYAACAISPDGKFLSYFVVFAVRLSNHWLFNFVLKKNLTKNL